MLYIQNFSSPYIFPILGGNLSGLTFNIVIMSLWKSDIPVSRVKHFLKLFELFVRKRSMHEGLLKFLKQVGSSFRAFNLCWLQNLSYLFLLHQHYNRQLVKHFHTFCCIHLTLSKFVKGGQKH